MANQEHLELLKRGVEVWNQWRKVHLEIQPDLSAANLREECLSWANLSEADFFRADLSEADLRKANLRGARLTCANLSEADLSDTDLYLADLSEANLNYANLSRANLNYANLSLASLCDADLEYTDLTWASLASANLSGADLEFANLSNADLISTNLSNADLTETNLTRALVWLTVFVNVDLSAVIGLDTISHQGPSSIGIDTIYRSQGTIPEVFLREMGVPETMRGYIRSLVGQPNDYYTCFISYSSKDQDFAERLYTDLQSNGVRCWYAPENMKIGDKIRHRIDESIRLYDKLLLVLSAHSIASKWVDHEVEMALAKERKEERAVLFPIRLDKTIIEMEQDGWPSEVQHTRHIGDFTKWKQHEDYQNSLNRLLRHLKAST